MNYAELTARIQEYCENDEATFVAAIPGFVRQAEERLVRAVMLPELRANATSTLTAGDRYLARPADYIATFSLAVIDDDGAYHHLYDKDANFIREAYPNPSTTGIPAYYAQFEGADTSSSSTGYFLLGPTPDDTYTVELHYYYDPPSIVDEGTSWFGDNAEAALLYGCLVEAYTFMKGDPDMMELYRARYTEALEDLRSVEARVGRDEFRDGRMAPRRR